MLPPPPPSVFELFFEQVELLESSEEGLRAAEPRPCEEELGEAPLLLCTSIDLVEMRSTRFPEERGLGLLAPLPVVVLTTRSPLPSTEEVATFEGESGLPEPPPPPPTGTSNLEEAEAEEELVINSREGVVEVTLTQLDLKMPFDCILSISEWIISPRGR